MTKFNTDDRVMTIEKGQLRKGVVKKVFSEISDPVVIVEFEDGNVEKISPDNIALEPKATVENASASSEDFERVEIITKSEITITPSEFKKIAVQIIAEECIENIDAIAGFGYLVSRLHSALFFAEAEVENE